MGYDVYYKKERNGKFTINVNDDKIQTPLTSESVAGTLCDDIYSFLNHFNEDDYFFEIQLSDESEPLGVIVDVWQDGEIETDIDMLDEEPFDSATFMFDDYSSNDDYDNDDDDDYDDYIYNEYDE